MLKQSAKPKTIDDYIADHPEHIQEILQKMRATIRKAAPKAEETINYGIPTFKLNGNLVHFAGYKNHIGFYLHPPVSKHLKNNYQFMTEPRDRSSFLLTNHSPGD